MEDDFCWRDGGWGGGLISSCFSLWPIVSPCHSHSAARECLFVHLILRSPSFLAISCSRLESKLLYLWLSLNPPLKKKQKHSLIFSLSSFFPLPFIWRGISVWDAAHLCSAKMLVLFVSPHPSCLLLCPPCFLPACVYNTCCGMDVWVGAGTYWQLPGNRLVHHFIMAQSP